MIMLASNNYLEQKFGTETNQLVRLLFFPTVSLHWEDSQQVLPEVRETPNIQHLVNHKITLLKYKNHMTCASQPSQ